MVSFLINVEGLSTGLKKFRQTCLGKRMQDKPTAFYQRGPKSVFQIMTYEIAEFTQESLFKVLNMMLSPVVKPQILGDTFRFHPSHGTLHKLFTLRDVFKLRAVFTKQNTLSVSIVLNFVITFVGWMS